MIKLIILCFCIYTVLSSPIQSFEAFDDIENDAEIVDAAEPLPGTGNLHEKRVPVIRLTIPGGYLGLYGTRNLAERTQVPYEQVLLPGIRNLDEKSIPQAVIARMGRVVDSRYPKSQVEKVVL